MKKQVYKIVCESARYVYPNTKLSGMICMLANQIERLKFAEILTAGINEMRVETTEKLYKKMREFLDTKYPGLCKIEISNWQR